MAQFLFTFIYFSKLKLKRIRMRFLSLPYDIMTPELASREGKEHSSITSIAMNLLIFCAENLSALFSKQVRGIRH